MNVFTNHIYLIYMFKEDLALDNREGYINQTKPNQVLPSMQSNVILRTPLF